MSTHVVTRPARLDDMPRPPVRRPRPRSTTLLRRVALAALAAAAVLGIAVRWPPAFYTARLAAPPDGAAARRLLTKVAALHEAGRTAAWDISLTEAECNAWLTDDLPRNHAALLPRGIEGPRVHLSPGACRVAAVVTEAAPLPGWLVRTVRPVLTARIEVRLAAVSRVECRLSEVRLGLVPLPAAPLLHALAERLRRTGLPCETPRVDGRSVLLLTWPPDAPGGPGVRLAALAIGEGEFLMAGTLAERP